MLSKLYCNIIYLICSKGCFMKGIWKAYIDKEFFIKDVKIKKNKYKHLKKDKFKVMYDKNLLEDDDHFYNKQINPKDIKKLLWIELSRKKFLKKLASSKNRNNLRSWIKKGDFEQEIPTHYLSGSMERELH